MRYFLNGKRDTTWRNAGFVLEDKISLVNRRYHCTYQTLKENMTKTRMERSILWTNSSVAVKRHLKMKFHLASNVRYLVVQLGFQYTGHISSLSLSQSSSLWRVGFLFFVPPNVPIFPQTAKYLLGIIYIKLVVCLCRNYHLLNVFLSLFSMLELFISFGIKLMWVALWTPIEGF